VVRFAPRRTDGSWNASLVAAVNRCGRALASRVTMPASSARPSSRCTDDAGAARLPYALYVRRVIAYPYYSHGSCRSQIARRYWVSARKTLHGWLRASRKIADLLCGRVHLETLAFAGVLAECRVAANSDPARFWGGRARFRAFRASAYFRVLPGRHRQTARPGRTRAELPAGRQEPAPSLAVFCKLCSESCSRVRLWRGLGLVHCYRKAGWRRGVRNGGCRK